MGLDRDSAAFLVSRDFMTNLDKLREVGSSNHLGTFLMNLRNSLEALKEVVQEDHVADRLHKEAKI